MLSRLIVGQGARVVGAFVGLVAFLFVTTPANATCYYCVDLGGGVYACTPGDPNYGYHNCAPNGYGCTMTGACQHFLMEDVDIDGQAIATNEAISDAILRSGQPEEETSKLSDYLFKALDPVVRNCKGLALTLIGGGVGGDSQPDEISL